LRLTTSARGLQRFGGGRKGSKKSKGGEAKVPVRSARKQTADIKKRVNRTREQGVRIAREDVENRNYKNVAEECRHELLVEAHKTKSGGGGQS